MKKDVLSAIPLALQHVVAMIVGCVTVPVILGGAANVGGANLVILIQASLLSAAIAILIQCFGKKKIGSELPVIVGSGFAFIPSLSATASTYGLSAVFGAQLIGAIVGILVGLSFKKIRFLFPPVVTSAVVITIGISLYPTAIRYIAGNVGSENYGSAVNWFVGIITLIMVLVLSNYAKGVFKIAANLIALIIGYIIAIPLGLVDFSPVAEAGYFVNLKPIPFGISFETSAIISISIVFIISAIQDMGQFSATANGALGRNATDDEISSGIIGNNIASLFASIFGGVPRATCGQNVGIVVTTGVTKKIVFVASAIIILICALIPKVAAIFLTIPYPVLGGATVTVFGSIAMTGIKMLVDAGLTNRNLSIVGLSVAMGIGISQSPSVLAGLPTIINDVFSGSAIVTATTFAVILNLILKKE